MVPRAGYRLKTIEAYGFSKKISIDNIKKNIKTIKSIGTAKKIIKEFKPDIVIGTGGYICIPVILAANKAKVPTALHESNAFPGLAVKVLPKKVDKIFVGFKDAKDNLTRAKEVIVTGTPTKIKRQNLSVEQIREKRKNLGLKPEIPFVLIFGGSQGAKKINDVIIEIIKKKMNKNYQIMWAAGQKNYEGIKEEFKELNLNIDEIENVKVVPYIYNMEDVMNIADLLVCRSGAITITEIAKLGKAAIFIPLPNVSHNHQEKNARVLQKAGATYIILDAQLTSDKLNETINEIIKDREKLIQMSENARKIDIENVEGKIYNEIKKLV